MMHQYVVQEFLFPRHYDALLNAVHYHSLISEPRLSKHEKILHETMISRLAQQEQQQRELMVQRAKKNLQAMAQPTFQAHKVGRKISSKPVRQSRVQRYS